MDIVLLGSGNVASHLGKAFTDAGHRIQQIWSRNADHANALANNLKTDGIHDFSALITYADIYVIAVSDDAIEHVLSQMPKVSGCLVHTSGSTSMKILSTKVTSYGVFYPLQTFSKGKIIDFNNTPILLEASDKNTLILIRTLAFSISSNVRECTTQQRSTLHVAAVFACNFSNHLYMISQRILEENGLDFDLLRPLIHETSAKVGHHLPSEVQTGPAVRNDQLTLTRHRKQLSDHKEWLEIYNLLSSGILGERQNGI